MKNGKKGGVNRRDFLKATAIGAGAMTLAGVPAKIKARTLPEKWDEKTDIVVVGSGGAGMMAAIKAHDGGAKVRILHKGVSVLTSSTAVSGGLFAAAGTRAQKKEGIEDSPEKFYQDLVQNGGFMNIPELVRLLTENSATVFEWLVDNGLPSFRFEGVPGHSVLRGHRANTNSGRDLVDTLFEQLKKRNIPVDLRTEVTRLFVNNDGRVVGVEALNGGKKMRIQAQQAVVVACGGFVMDAETFDSWVPAYAGAGNLTGDPANAGQGIKMITKYAGGLATHLQFTATYPYGLETAARSGPVCRYWYFTPLGAILVNKEGKRYANEMMSPTRLTSYLAQQTEKAHYLITTKSIWDEVFAKYPPGGVISPSSPEWIEKQLDEGKWLFRGDSIRDLAVKAGINAEALEKTVSEFNGYVDLGEDQAFNRDPKTLGGKLEGYPLYSVKMTFATVLTMGGSWVNNKCQALDPYGKPIPGLYAAGETVGGVHGNMYLGGCALAWAHTSGWVAGINAAKEKV